MMRRIFTALLFGMLFTLQVSAQTVYSWTPGVNPGWTSSDGNLTWRAGCSAVTTNCSGSYSNNLFTYYYSGAINTTCTTASTINPSFNISGDAEPSYDLIYFYYSYDGVNWTNFYGAGVGFSGNTGGIINQVLPAISTSPTTYFLILFESDWIYRYQGYQITNFSCDCNVVLPVELTTLDAENNGDQNVIKWTTESEINNSHFTVERTTDGVNFDVVKIEEGRGNSDSETNYKVVDDKFVKGKINYYRLTQVDFDGKEETFDMVSVDNRDTEAKVLKTVNLFGQVVTEDYKGIVIDYYDDGSTKKRYQP